MANDFKHISIQDDDDDIVVNVAGGRVQTEAKPAVQKAPTRAPKPIEAVEPTAESVAANAAVNVPASAATSAPAPAASASAPVASAPADSASAPSAPGTSSPASSLKPKKARTAPKEDDFHETTLEDLEGTPMSKIQIVVLSVMGAILVGFGFYWFAVYQNCFGWF